MARNEGSATGRTDARLDADEFAARLRQSFRSLWLIAVAITRDGALAEDVVQDAAIIGLDKLDTFSPDTNFTAWVGQIVRNVALNRTRKERRSRTVSFDPETLRAYRDDALYETSHSDSDMDNAGSAHRGSGAAPDLDRRIYEAFDAISDTARACLLLRTIEGWNYARIAETLEIPEGTAMSHVHRSRKLLRKLLAEGTGDAADQEKPPS